MVISPACLVLRRIRATCNVIYLVILTLTEVEL